MSDIWLFFLAITAMLLFVWRLANGHERPMTKREQERMFFRQAYGLSIDRMLSDLSPDSLVPVWGVRSRGRCLAR